MSDNEKDSNITQRILLLLAMLGGAAVICYNQPKLLKLRIPPKIETVKPITVAPVTVAPVTVEPSQEKSSNFRYLMYVIFNNPGLIINIATSIQSLRNYREIIQILNNITNNIQNFNVRNPIVQNPIVENQNPNLEEVIEVNRIQNNDQFIDQNIIRNPNPETKGYNPFSGGKKLSNLKKNPQIRDSSEDYYNQLPKDIKETLIKKFQNHGGNIKKNDLNIPERMVFVPNLNQKLLNLVSKYKKYPKNIKLQNFTGNIRHSGDLVVEILTEINWDNLNLQNLLNEMIMEADELIENINIEGGIIERLLRLRLLLTQDEIINSIIHNPELYEDINLNITEPVRKLQEKMDGLINYLEELYFELFATIQTLRDFYNQDIGQAFQQLSFLAMMTEGLSFTSRQTFENNFRNMAAYYNIHFDNLTYNDLLGRIRMLHYTNRNNEDYRQLILRFSSENQNNINELFSEVKDELLNVLNKK